MKIRVRVIRFEKFSLDEIRKGYPDSPTITSKSQAMEILEATKTVNVETELMLSKGWKLKRGPEGFLSFYKEESTSIVDYHFWYRLERIKEEN
jgi:hypothetical protein